MTELQKPEFQKQILSLNLRSLDALRGFLAIYVLAGHCRWLLWVGNIGWSQHPHSWYAEILVYASASLRYGHEAVIIFFVLSGFFIHLRVSKQLAQSKTFQLNVINFFHRRCHRLVPPYILALALTAILDIAGRFLYPTLYTSLTGDLLLDQNFLKKEFSVTSIFPALFMLPSSMGKDFGSNGPLWSLAYEVIYYLLYPLWLKLRNFGALPAYSAGVVVAVLGQLFFMPSFATQVLIHYPIWLSGALIAEIGSQKKLIFTKKDIWVSSLLLIITFIATHFPLGSLLLILVYAILGSTLVLLITSLPLSICKHPLHKYFEILGIESYTIYICHFPIITFISAWAFEVLDGRPVHGLLALGGGLFTLLVCHILFLLCERNFLHSRLKIND
ncbi:MULTISPECIES: acyltransferase family protein [unclassified Nostoc]|uniref:acyltransferase family protein n=1 Tax=unclassified Nostoc TaxID=2593658 RepID=UPI002AD3E219|nr:acyltransferase [Nostoc sp. ChiQUE02]MDZ8233018.1 acyltransferase [Nostoc sp. ChiQUE02]